jgi:hypothetical protein
VIDVIARHRRGSGEQELYHEGHEEAQRDSREDSLRLLLRRKHRRGSSLAVADAPAALGMTEGGRDRRRDRTDIAGIRKENQPELHKIMASRGKSGYNSGIQGR